MKTRILSALRKAEGYISGQQLCGTLQVSRTAVWKTIEQLKAEGYKIEAMRGRGYYLKEAPDILSEAELKSVIATAWAGSDVHCFSELDSTNIYAKRLGDEGAAHGTLVTAERQTAGKGRRGRSWESPPGSSIYMSILLRPKLRPERAPMLTLVMAQSVAEAIGAAAGGKAQIKWPNDIVLNRKKVCGILTEMSMEIETGWIGYVIIGVGINVNTESFPEELAGTATSLYLEDGRKRQRSRLAAEVMERFEQYYESFCRVGDLSEMREAYNRLLVNQGRDVRVLEPGNEYNGHALGINDNGELLVRRENGKVEAIYAGEVSVRGIYGYV